ncbi:MAG: prephenate dehydrogenase [Planctomycetota bacterium]
MTDHFGRVAIVGTGLLGASVGLGLKRRGAVGEVIGIGRTQTTLDEAKRVGAIDRGTDDYAALAECDLAVVAVPLGAFDAVFAAMAGHANDGLVITDVGSTKRLVGQAARKHLPDPRRCVGSHPMAGKATAGPADADADLFVGKPCVICAAEHDDPAAIAAVESLWQTLGSNLIRMTPERHDAAVAATSHLPHAAAVALVAAAQRLGPDGWQVASTGFASTTRLASSNPPMRADIMTANADHLDAALAIYIEELQAIRTALRPDKRDDLLNQLSASMNTRDTWLDTKPSPKP